MVINEFDEKYPLNQINQKEFFSKAEGHNIFYRILYTEISIENNRYILAAKIPMIEPHDLRNMMITQYGIIFFIIISLSLTYLYISRRLWKPFYNTLDKLENFSLEDGKELQFENTNIIEFSRLNKQLKKLIKSNLYIYKQQKEFIENVSHELQTPLAVFQSQIDMLLQQKNLTEKKMDLLIFASKKKF